MNTAYNYCSHIVDSWYDSQMGWHGGIYEGCLQEWQPYQYQWQQAFTHYFNESHCDQLEGPDLTSCVAGANAYADALAAMQNNGTALYRPLGIIHRKKKQFHPALQAFLDMLCEAPVE